MTVTTKTYKTLRIAFNLTERHSKVELIELLASLKLGNVLNMKPEEISTNINMGYTSFMEFKTYTGDKQPEDATLDELAESIVFELERYDRMCLRMKIAMKHLFTPTAVEKRLEALQARVEGLARTKADDSLLQMYGSMVSPQDEGADET